MEWKYVKPLTSEELINEFECMVKYSLPNDFKACVMEHNGGRPERRAFDTDVSKERELKSFLSFNKEDKETIWKIHDWNHEELKDKYVAFAIDNFGNLICFDVCSNRIVFMNLDDMSIEGIADDFESFIRNLYD